MYMTDEEISSLRETKKETLHISGGNKLQKKDIVFEDEYLLILNKNPGINVHP
jgi:23S rRNA-/tRNA-specific pseudouridylate synthase